jgi:hypothetical protein
MSWPYCNVCGSDVSVRRSTNGEAYNPQIEQQEEWQTYCEICGAKNKITYPTPEQAISADEEGNKQWEEERSRWAAWVRKNIEKER